MGIHTRTPQGSLSIFAALGLTWLGHGVIICLGRSGHMLCTVAPLLGCTAQNGQQPGPFFPVPGCRHISQRKATVQHRWALNYHGVDVSGLPGHSFGIRVAVRQPEQRGKMPSFGPWAAGILWSSVGASGHLRYCWHLWPRAAVVQEPRRPALLWLECRLVMPSWLVGCRVGVDP